MDPMFRPTSADSPGASTPRRVDLHVFLADISERTGAAPVFVQAVFNDLVDAGDIRCERDPEQPSGFAVIPSPTLARYASPAVRTTTGGR